MRRASASRSHARILIFILVSDNQNQVDEIKNRLDVCEFVRGYMKLEKSGSSFRGLCPFHKEKTPSFFVSPSRQLWKCFGCGVGGDLFSFFMQIEGVDFKEALSSLAEKAGVALRSYDPHIRSEKTRLYEICEKACQFFEKQLTSSMLGAEVKEYLLGRGIHEDSIKKFRLGFAPYTRNALLQYLRALGYSPTEIFKCGVSVQVSGAFLDRFRGRVMFPIFDLNGQVIGFGGRVFFRKNQVPDKNLAKYINTPQTLLYDKSRVLYGLHAARMNIRETQNCVLVEGYTDCIMAHQTGVTNAVAVSGTALTEQQLDLMKRYTENLILLFDMDTAGDNATKRGIHMALAKGFQLKVVILPEGKDPAELIQKNEEAWKKAIEKPLSIGDFYFQNALARFDRKDPQGMRQISGMILPVIKQIPSAIEQSYWVQKLAAELICAESAIWSDLEKTPLAYGNAEVSHEKPKAEDVSSIKKTKREMLYARILLLLSKNPSCKEIFEKKDTEFFDEKSALASACVKLKKGQELLPAEKELLEGILFEDEVFPQVMLGMNVLEEFRLCLETLRELTLKSELQEIQQKLKQDQTNEELLKKFHAVSIKLAKL
ncbi:MAG: DNA primase [Candidatus Spechtbacteria bacterium]|nr:DNA primase [Candidatus Spechtbacteria bacterium]